MEEVKAWLDDPEHFPPPPPAMHRQESGVPPSRPPTSDEMDQLDGTELSDGPIFRTCKTPPPKSRKRGKRVTSHTCLVCETTFQCQFCKSFPAQKARCNKSVVNKGFRGFTMKDNYVCDLACFLIYTKVKHAKYEMNLMALNL